MHFSDQIREMAATCRQDPAHLMGIKSAVMETGLAAMLGLMIDESKLDPFRPCPRDWKAMQLAFFDNGEPAPKRKRPKIERTKMRFGCNIMVWTRDEINFNKANHVAWQANAYLWTAEQAREIARDLMDEKYVDQETVDLVNDYTVDVSDDARFSIPLLRVGTATRWMRRHLMITKLTDGVPATAAIVFPETGFMSSQPFVDYLADGQAVSGRAISQARVARDPSLGQWATEVLA